MTCPPMLPPVRPSARPPGLPTPASEYPDASRSMAHRNCRANSDAYLRQSFKEHLLICVVSPCSTKRSVEHRRRQRTERAPLGGHERSARHSDCFTEICNPCTCPGCFPIWSFARPVCPTPHPSVQMPHEVRPIAEQTPMFTYPSYLCQFSLLHKSALGGHRKGRPSTKISTDTGSNRRRLSLSHCSTNTSNWYICMYVYMYFVYMFICIYILVHLRATARDPDSMGPREESHPHFEVWRERRVKTIEAAIVDHADMVAVLYVYMYFCVYVCMCIL